MKRYKFIRDMFVSGEGCYCEVDDHSEGEYVSYKDAKVMHDALREIAGHTVAQPHRAYSSIASEALAKVRA